MAWNPCGVGIRPAGGPTRVVNCSWLGGSGGGWRASWWIPWGNAPSAVCLVRDWRGIQARRMVLGERILVFGGTLTVFGERLRLFGERLAGSSGDKNRVW